MARIPDQVVERLKTDISVQRLAEARGVVFRSTGATCSAAARSTTTGRRRWW